MRLIIVDDNQESRSRLTHLAELQGYEVAAPTEQDEALRLLTSDDFDLAVVGLRDSATNGNPVLRHLKRTPPELRRPLLVVTGTETANAVSEWLNARADDYLIEPFSPALLAFRLAACLERDRLCVEREVAQSELAEKNKLVHDLTSVILPIGAALSAEKDPDRLLERIVLEAKTVCSADAGTLYLRTDEDTLKFTIMRTDSLGIALGGTTGKEVTQPALSMYNPDTGEPNEHNIASHVALHAESVNIADVYHAEGFDFSGTKVFDARNGYRTKSCLAVPLVDHSARVIGVLQLINALDPKTGEVMPFDDYARQVVESLASLAAVAISSQRLLEQQQKLLKLERDIQIGRQIQADFLPQELPSMPGWEIAATFRPAREVSGDFYDVFAFPGQRDIGLVIADVSDKGVAAALFMALIRSLLRAYSEVPVAPSMLALAERYAVSTGPTGNLTLTTLLSHLNAINTVLLTNNYLVGNHSQANMFATMFWGVLDPSSGLLTYVNCGHEPLMVLNANGVKAQLPSTGQAVGIFPDLVFDIAQITLEPGDWLFGYTDGVTDARSPSGEFFSSKKLLPLLETLVREDGPIDVHHALRRVEAQLLAHISTADQFDDITMLAVRRGQGQPEPPAA